MIAFLEQNAGYVVLWVTLIVWAGIAGLLVAVETRLRRLERSVERTAEQERFSDYGGG